MAICSLSFLPPSLSRLNTPASHPASFFHHRRVAFSISSALFAARRCPFFLSSLRFAQKPVFLLWNRRVDIVLPRMYGFFSPPPPPPPLPSDFSCELFSYLSMSDKFHGHRFCTSVLFIFRKFYGFYSWMNDVIVWKKENRGRNCLHSK